MDYMQRLALEAGHLTLHGFGRCDQVSKVSQDGYDIATEYDFRAERLIRNRLIQDFSEPVLGEEEGLIGNRQDAMESLWIVDPIDGTFNYQRGLPLYGVSIAYCEKGMPVCGAIFLPALNELYSAAKGSGAFVAEGGLADPTPVRVRSERELERMVISLAGRNTYPMVAACATEGVPWRSLRFLLCAVASMVYIASGRMDIFADAALGLWDCAAGDIILQEAGGPAMVDYQGIAIFPEYLNRSLQTGDLSKLSAVAASSPELLQDPVQRLLSSSGSWVES
jgi:myo-inositol-1(or 4)-monophosphatase